MAREIDELGSQVRRSAGLHALYAAAGLLVGLLLPVAQVRINQDELLPERYTALGLVFGLHSDYEVDHSTLVVLAGLAVALTALTAIVAFLVAAAKQNRPAATVALAACALLVPVLVLAGFVFGVTDIESGSNDDPLEGWAVGCWVLLGASLAGSWIATFLRDLFDT